MMQENSELSVSLSKCVESLQQHKVIAYPTEAVFGLGCDPESEFAVLELLALKQRPVEKGLILIAESYQQLLPFIDSTALTKQQLDNMFSYWPGPVTFVVPAAKHTPAWLTGKFSTIAVRVTDHPVVRQLCQRINKPLVSTSANLSGAEPAKHWQEVAAQFGEDFPVVKGETGGRENPSEIRDAITLQLIRQG